MVQTMSNKSRWEKLSILEVHQRMKAIKAFISDIMMPKNVSSNRRRLLNLQSLSLGSCLQHQHLQILLLNCVQHLEMIINHPI